MFKNIIKFTEFIQEDSSGKRHTGSRLPQFRLRSILCFAKYAFGAATIPCSSRLAGESFILSKYLFILIYCKSDKIIGSFIFSISFISSIFFRSTSLKTDSEKFGFIL